MVRFEVIGYNGQPPLVDQARLAIDALGCLVDGLKGRLGEGEDALKEGLTNLRLAWGEEKARAYFEQIRWPKF